MIEEDLSYLMDEYEEGDYDDEELSLWNYDDWLASGVETSADWHQYFDQDHVRLTSLSPQNSTETLDRLSSQTLPIDSYSSSSTIYSLIDLTENCISPSLSQLINQLYWILAFCILFRLLYLSKFFSSKTLHSLQICSSILILYTYFHFQSIYLLTYVLIGYLAFQLCLEKCRHYLTHIIVYFSIIYVLACEFILIEQEKWHGKYQDYPSLTNKYHSTYYFLAIRGVQMCIMMKMISLAIDHRYFERMSPSNTDQSIIYPTAMEFFSYILSIHNTIFGPWMNYRNYIRYFHQDYPSKKIDFFELAKGVYYFLRVAFCLLVSTCLTDWFLRHYFFSSDQDDSSSQHGWRVAYFQALSYRFSHYCVCFIGELTGHMSGLEFNVEEYRNYSEICQQAQERIDNERKSREQAETVSNDSHPGKRRHRNRKHSNNKTEETDGSIVDEQQNSSQIR